MCMEKSINRDLELVNEHCFTEFLFSKIRWHCFNLFKGPIILQLMSNDLSYVSNYRVSSNLNTAV